MATLTHKQHMAAARAGTLYTAVLIAFISIVMFLLATDVITIVAGSSPIVARAKMVLLGPMILFIALYYGRSVRGVAALPEIPLLVALAALSVLWSYQPFSTAERALPLVVTTMFAITLASIFSLRNLVITFGFIGAFMMIGSILAIAVIPEARGRPPWENTWNGIFGHKNGLGAASVLSFIFALCATNITTGNLRRFFVFVLLLSAFLLAASESRSPQIVALFSLGAAGVFYAMRRWALIWGVGYLFIVVFFLLIVSYLLSTDVLEPVFEAVDRKPTLSGRLPLWSLMGPYIVDEFWVGYGYRAFWDPTSARVLEISRDLGLGFTPFYSHNGLIETWLHLGLLGFLVLLAALLRVGVSCYRIMRQKSDRTAFVAIILVIIAFVLMNTTEGTILSRTNLSWMSFVAFGTKACLIANLASVRPPTNKNSRRARMQRRLAVVGDS